jgi:hypothetical protein
MRHTQTHTPHLACAVIFGREDAWVWTSPPDEPTCDDHAEAFVLTIHAPDGFDLADLLDEAEWAWLDLSTDPNGVSSQFEPIEWAIVPVAFVAPDDFRRIPNPDGVDMDPKEENA